jgi:hypothetical protein
MSELPERVNVMRVVSYNVADYIERIKDNRASGVIYDRSGSRSIADDSPITIEEVIDLIENDCYDDFAGEVRLSELIFQDENGNEL